MAPPKDPPDDADDHEDEDEDDEKDEKDGEQAPSASKPASKAAADEDDDDDDDEDDDDGEDDDEDEDEAKPAAKPAPAKAAAGKPSAAKPGSGKPAAKASASKGPASKRSAGPQRARPRMVAATPAQRQKKGSLMTSVVLFVVVVGGLATGFAVLGRETGSSGPAVPKWNVGQEVDVEITLVPTDQKDLACASGDQIAGRHCAFESQAKAWSKPGDADEKLLLKPYTTTNQVQFVGAGLWSDPGMKKDKLPATRFTVKCKYKVEGKMRKPAVRWSSEGPWYERTEDWYSGLLSSCVIAT